MKESDQFAFETSCYGHYGFEEKQLLHDGITSNTVSTFFHRSGMKNPTVNVHALDLSKASEP